MPERKEPFVSGAYDEKDDAQNRPLPSIRTTANQAIKKKKVRRFYSAKRTRAVIAAEKRRYPDD